MYGLQEYATVALLWAFHFSLAKGSDGSDIPVDIHDYDLVRSDFDQTAPVFNVQTGSHFDAAPIQVHHQPTQPRKSCIDQRNELVNLRILT
jgi:hypothetical protein